MGFGLSARDSIALFRLGFPAAPGVLSLNLAAHGLLVGPFYKKYAVTLRLPLLIGTEFQGLFHSPSGVLFTFPSRYSFTIGPIRSLALEGGPPCFDPDFTCPNLLWIYAAASAMTFQVRGFHPLRLAFPGPFPCVSRAPSGVSDAGTLTPCNPNRATLRSLALEWFGLFPFRSSLLRESRI